MNCPKCGKEIESWQRFCSGCGTRVAPAEEPAALPQTSEPPAEPAFFAVAPEEASSRQIPPAAEPEQANYMPPTAPRPAYDTPVAEAVTQCAGRPRIQLPTRRGLAKMFFLGIVTLGIYPTVIWSRIVTELNLVASRYDGERTMPYFAMVTLAPLTLSIYVYVWMHGFCRRVGAELQRRGINYHFDASTFWLWNILGSLILVGPFIFLHKLMKSMNLLNEDYNRVG